MVVVVVVVGMVVEVVGATLTRHRAMEDQGVRLLLDDRECIVEPHCRDLRVVEAAGPVGLGGARAD